MDKDTKHSKAEDERRDFSHYWQATFDAMMDAVALLDTEGKILRCNRSMQTLIGKPPDEIIGRHCYELVHSTARHVDGCPLIRMKKTLRREAMLLPLDGRWFKVAVDPLLDEYGSLTGAVHSLTDVTEQKWMEEDLRKELQTSTAMAVLASRMISPVTIEELSYSVLEHAKHLTGSPFGFVGHIDSETGYLLSTTLTRDIWNICQVQDKVIVFKEFRGLWGWVLNNQQSILTNSPQEDTRSSGTPPGHIPIRRFLSAPAMIDGNLAGQIALANADRDYTERDRKVVERLADLFAIAIQRKQSEDALQKSEERFRQMAENIPDGLTIMENDQVVYLNDRACEIFGYAREELMKLTGYDLAAPEEKERLRLIIEESRRIKQSFREAEFWIVRKDGTRRFIHNRHAYNYQNDDIVGRYVITTDISERKQAEESLRQSEERFRSVVETAIDAIIIADHQGKILSWNNAAERMYGYAAEEVIGKHFTIIMPERYHQQQEDRLHQVVAKEQSGVVGRAVETTGVRKDGSEFSVEISNSLWETKDGIFFAVISRDVTGRREAKN